MKSAEEKIKLDIQKANDRIHGRYPMTYNRLVQEINQVDTAWVNTEGPHFMTPAVYLMYAVADGIQNNPEEMYRYYIEEVKPYQSKL